MRRPVIGILSRVEAEGSAEKNYIGSDYIEAVHKAGGMPIILPLILDDEVLKAQIDMVDGLLVPGGIDVNSLIYGEEPIKEQGSINDSIDDFDLKAITIAKKMDKPILGICRGCQVINVAFGGTLYQDLSQIETYNIKHSQQAKKYFPSHTINIKDESILASIMGSKSTVNSYHHQAVKKIAPGFEISAYSLDGVVEAIESLEGFILGIQWHPEGMVSKSPNMLKLFERFVRECSKDL